MVFVTVLVVTLVHVAPGSPQPCGVSAPVPSLPAQLRALGGFDQAFSAGDTVTLTRTAASAAAAVAPGLIGTRPERPVAETATRADKPDALLVPLTGTTAAAQSGRVVGLVAFLLDCSGRAYFSAVEDLVARGAATAQTFPSVSQAAAEQQLGTAAPQLVYRDDPFRPDWLNRTTGTSVPAFSAA